MKFQGENCVLNMASYFNRNDVLVNGTLWVPRPGVESIRYQHPWLHFSHTLLFSENDRLRQWLRDVAAGQPVEPLQLPGPIRQLTRLESVDTTDVSLSFQYDQSPEPIWWAWDITAPLLIRIDIPHNEFTQLITVFDRVEWSFY